MAEVVAPAAESENETSAPEDDASTSEDGSTFSKGSAAITARSNRRQKKEEAIKLKDAVGRKFSLPFHMAATWEGIESLIKQAFKHVEVLNVHVDAGHYDLVGPNGEIILPQVWAETIEPGWYLTMHMWPIAKPVIPRPGESNGSPLPIPPGWEIDLKATKILSFPSIGGIGTNGKPSIHLMLFPFTFGSQVQGRTVIVDYRLTMPVTISDASDVGKFDFAKMAFFEPSEPLESLTRWKQIKDSYTAIESTCSIFVQSAEEYVFAVLVQRPRTETASKLSVLLNFAVEIEGETRIVKEITGTATIDTIYKEGLTPFSWALIQKWEDTMLLLLAQPEVSRNVRDADGQSALTWAVKMGHIAAVDYLLSVCADIDMDEKDNHGRTALSWVSWVSAAEEEHRLTIAQRLLSRAEEDYINEEDVEGRTPLSWAVESDSPSLITLLLEQGGDKQANSPDKRGMRPLAWAVSCSLPLTIDSDEPGSAMYQAYVTGNESIVGYLIKEQIRQSKEPLYKALSIHDGWILEVFYLHKAATYGYATVCKLILDLGVHPDALMPGLNLSST